MDEAPSGGGGSGGGGLPDIPSGARDQNVLGLDYDSTARVYRPTWKKGILAGEQVDHMFDMFYSVASGDVNKWTEVTFRRHDDPSDTRRNSTWVAEVRVYLGLSEVSGLGFGFGPSFTSQNNHIIYISGGDDAGPYWPYIVDNFTGGGASGSSSVGRAKDNTYFAQSWIDHVDIGSFSARTTLFLRVDGIDSRDRIIAPSNGQGKMFVLSSRSQAGMLRVYAHTVQALVNAAVE